MKKRIKTSEFYFALYYITFVVALFSEDIAFQGVDISVITKWIKATVTIVLIIASISKSWKKSTFVRLLVGIFVGIVILLCSGDFFWIIVILMGFISENIDEKHILKITFWTTLILTIFVILLYISGVVPDIYTYRTDFSNEIRHSIGFIHSSVLPLISLYLFCYFLLLKKENIRKRHLVLFLLISLILYRICLSRNALIFSIFLIMIEFLLGFEKIKLVLTKKFNILSGHLATICMIFSIIPGYLRYKGVLVNVWYMLDAIFTNRTMLAAAAIKNYGIHFLNKMNYETYSSKIIQVDNYQWNGIVLDSAYLYIVIRYGMFVLILLWFIFWFLHKKNINQVIDNVVVVTLILVNMIDNDILSYGFLPIMLIGIRSFWKYTYKKESRNKSI